MRITYHAGERFLQRVLGLTTYSKKEILRAMRLLKRDFYHLELRHSMRVVLPSFPDFYGVFQDKTLVTIIPKK